MRFGVMSGAGGGEDKSFKGLIDRACRLEAMGFDDLWLANIFSYDALTAITVMGTETHRIGLGTAVVPSYPRHPSALAQQVLTTNIVCDGRLTLGLGLSHKLVIEDMLGMSYAKPASHMEEYLEVLAPLLRGEAAAFNGEAFRVHCQLDLPEATRPSLVVAALGPRMLEIAGRLADGTTTWMVGPETLKSHIIPTIKAATAASGRPAPRVVAGLPIALTQHVEKARETINEDLAIYGQLPSYRAMLDREGAEGPADIALLGDEEQLKAEIAALKDLGVTDFNAAVMDVEEGCYERTLEFLAELKTGL